MTSRKLAINGNVQFIAPSICYTPIAGCEFACDGKHFGDSPRNVLYGPGLKNVDFSLSRDKPIRGNVLFELRFDA